MPEICDGEMAKQCNMLKNWLENIPQAYPFLRVSAYPVLKVSARKREGPKRLRVRKSGNCLDFVCARCALKSPAPQMRARLMPFSRW